MIQSSLGSCGLPFTISNQISNVHFKWKIFCIIVTVNVQLLISVHVSCPFARAYVIDAELTDTMNQSASMEPLWSAYSRKQRVLIKFPSTVCPFLFNVDTAYMFRLKSNYNSLGVCNHFSV